MMLKILVIILIVVLGISIYGNFQLLQNNGLLTKDLDTVKTENSVIVNELDSLKSKINILQTNQSQTNQDAFPKSAIEETDSNLLKESIKAVAVKPVLIREGFFQNVRYEGTVMNIDLFTEKGSGLVLVNTEIPTGVDFQSSAKIAVQVAENYLKKDLSDTNIIFSITADKNTDLQAVDGQSAGAAMTVLLISSLQEKEIDQSVIMTGTINSDMSIGVVGGISEKADAAGKQGAKIFLVPATQAITFVEGCDERKAGNFIYRSCSSEQKPLSPITEEKYGMKTIEVKNIQDALLYFQ